MHFPPAPPIRWAVPDLSKRADELKAELEQLDLSRDELIALASTHKSHGEWLERLIESRERDMRLRALAFPECCQAPLGFEAYCKSSYCQCVVSRVQVPFKGCRLAVDPECAPFFDIVDIKIGQRSCLVNSVQIAATLFPPLPKLPKAEEKTEHDQVKWNMPIAHCGADIAIEVRGRDENVGRIFRAAIWGHYFET